MSNTPLRAAFWTLLLACGLLTVAASTDPYATHLALNMPEPPPSSDSLDPVDQLRLEMMPPTLVAEQTPGGSPAFSPAARDPFSLEPDGPATRANGGLPANIPLPGTMVAAASPRTIAVPQPVPAATPRSTPPRATAPIQVAASGDVRLDLQPEQRPMRRDLPALPRATTTGDRSTSLQPGVRRPVPAPLEPTLANTPSQLALAELPPSPTFEPPGRATSAPQPVARPRTELDRLPPRAASGPVAAAGRDTFAEDLFPADRATASQPPSMQSPVVPQVAQLDILNQLRDLQSAQQRNRQAVMGNADLRRTLAEAGAVSDGVPLDQLDGEGDELASPEVPDPVLEFEPAGRNGQGEETFRLQIADAPVAQVLEMIGDLGEMNILTSTAVEGTVTNNLYDVTVEEALEAITRSYDLETERVGKFVHVTTATVAEQRREAARNTISKVYRPGFIAVRDLADVIAPLLTPEIGVVSVTTPAESGIESNNSEAGGDSLAQPDALVVIDYAERIAEIDRLVEQMDVAPPQVAIDAVIMQVRLNDQLNLGVNLAFAGSGNNDLLVSGNGAAIAQSTGFPLPSVAGTSEGANEIIEPLGRFVSSQAGLSFGYLRGDFSALFDALEKITDVSLVASPHVQVVNKQKAEIIIGERLGYKTLGFNATQTIENVQFLDAGTKLLLRPYIGPEGLIRLEVHPERSSAQIDPISGLPQQQTTEVTTNVMIRDGQTLVIGGLIEEQVVRDESQVPLLGSIPVLGRAFQNTAEQIIRTELIVLLTPRIVREADSYHSAALEQEFAARAENFHNSITPIARDQLAAMHRRHAEEAFAQGQVAEAWQHVQKALLLDPNDLRTLRLRDRIRPTW